MEAAPILSDLADKHVGKIAFIGINNDGVYGPDKAHNVEKVKSMVESKKEIMRFTVVLDSEHHAKKGKTNISQPSLILRDVKRLRKRNVC